MKIGARTLKTGIAIFLTMFITSLFEIEETTTLATIAAVTAMQNSSRRSLETTSKRIIANTIGGLVALAALYFFGQNYFIIAATSIVLIGILHEMKLDSVITLAVITQVIIMLSDGDDYVYVAISRVVATIIGVVVGFFVNELIMRPQYDERFFSLLVVMTDEIAKLIRSTLRKNIPHKRLKEDIAGLWANYGQLARYIDFIKGDIVIALTPNKMRHKLYSKTRKLVVYRQFLRATQAGTRLIETFHANTDILNHFPEDLRIIIRERLETLTSAHEQILWKFSGRIGAEDVNFADYKRPMREKFLSRFFEVTNSEEFLNEDEYNDSNSAIFIMAAIFKYEQEINHLNTLVRSYKTFHQDSDVQVEEAITID